MLADLRSGDARRVTAALARASTFERTHVAQIIDLLAWDEVLPAARTLLEQLAPAHAGMLIDALLDPATDFAIRRRLPRILGTCPTARSLDGVVSGLDDHALRSALSLQPRHRSDSRQEPRAVGRPRRG